MNIVYVSDQYWPSVSGVPVSIDSFKESFTKKGHQISLIVPDYPDAEKWDKENNAKNIFRFRSRSIFFNEENRLVYHSEKKKIFLKLDQIKPDIIHIHTEFSLANIVILYAKKNKIPLVSTAHTNWEEMVNLYIKFIPKSLSRFICRTILQKVLNKVDVVIAPTSLMKNKLLQCYIDRAIKIIPTGIDEATFANNSTNLNNDDNQFLINLTE